MERRWGEGGGDATKSSKGSVAISFRCFVLVSSHKGVALFPDGLVFCNGVGYCVCLILLDYGYI